MSDLFARLAAPLPPDRVSWRVGPTNADKTKGMALAYIDARDVMERLDEACTPAGWQCEYVPMPDHTTCCRIGIKVGDEWIWKSDGGSNIAESDKADAQEMAAKGGYSDAFKRAAVRWGIGRYLYDTASPWVEIEARGKSYVIKDSERLRLARSLKTTGAAPVAPTPAPPPTEPPEAEQREALEALTAGLGGIATLGGMDTWRKLPENIAAFGKLGPRRRAEFQHKLTTRREELIKANGAAP